MNAMHTIKQTLLAGTVLLAATAAKPVVAAETLEGTWEGRSTSVMGKDRPDNPTYDWKAGKWNFPVPATYLRYVHTLKLQGPHKNVTGTWASTYNGLKPGEGYAYEIDGSFNVEKKR